MNEKYVDERYTNFYYPLVIVDQNSSMVMQVQLKLAMWYYHMAVAAYFSKACKFNLIS
jgi:hypothetical protein